MKVEFYYNEIVSLFSWMNTFLMFSAIFAYCYLNNGIKRPKRDSSIDDFFLKPCPNPDCIRCRRYKHVQESAKRRLPYVLRDLKTKQMNISLVKRVIDGVNRGPVHASKVAGQYPSVLFVPNLPVYSISTNGHNTRIRDVFERNTSIADVLLSEYINSQAVHSNLWQNNYAGSTNRSISTQLWQVFYLMNQGRWIEDNVKVCPQTKEFVIKIPNLMEKCLFGNVFFSVIFPGTKIEQHCGPTNTRHRLHFPIYIPSDIKSSNRDEEPFLTILHETVRWKEGKAFVFDDSLVHSVEYPDSKSSEVRVVLIIDLWHSDLSLNERSLISNLFSC